MKRFVLIGAAGYIAPRHFQAIRDTGNELVAAYDISDSVGVLDSYFSNTQFFTEWERLDRFIDKEKRNHQPLDYLVVCSPNYLHDAHIRFGLKHGMDVICEKPLVLNPWNADVLQDIEREVGKKVSTILQLRLHPEVIALKNKVEEDSHEKYQVNLQYITPRGPWYHHSWKGDIQKSGGIATNIGIHFFDMLIWIFGSVDSMEISNQNRNSIQGRLQLERADVTFFLSIDAKDLPHSMEDRDKPYRRLSIGVDEIDFSNVFSELHTESYRQILDGNGFGIEETIPSIHLVHRIRNYNR